MPYIAPEVIQEAKQMDLLTYLKNYEPYELVRFSGNVYTTKTHDSLKISNGKWMWWSRGIGGRSALDYLIKVKGYAFLDAVQTIAGQAAIEPPVSPPAEKSIEKKLLLPKPNRCYTKVVSYLKGRGIDRDIIQFCLHSGQIYESESYHNAVFVGRDREGQPRYAALRGIGTDFIGDANGSDKNYSFSIPAVGDSGIVICLSRPLTYYLMLRYRRWKGRTGGKNTCYPLQEYISQQGSWDGVKCQQRLPSS